jgi:UTP-glucose-1-phosphate uridylyltransferase
MRGTGIKKIQMVTQIKNQGEELPMKVRKAIIPAAGLGTRFLPATKAQPKEMLPIVDKPTLQYIIEEAIESGIEEILIITGRNKSSIENHFDKSVELELELEKSGKVELLEEVKKISDMVNIHYIRQKEPKGLGHAIYCAKSFVSNEPFAVLLVPMRRSQMDCFLKRILIWKTLTRALEIFLRRLSEITIPHLVQITILPRISSKIIIKTSLFV